MSEELRAALRAQLDDDVPLPLIEAERLKAAALLGESTPIVLSLGETWRGPPNALRAALGNVPAAAHGYQLSMYGLPELRRLLKRQLSEEYEVSISPAWELAVLSCGTRTVMQSYGSYIAREDGCAPVLVTTAPGYDYAGIFAQAAFPVQWIILDPLHGFRPRGADIRAALERARRDHPGRRPLLVINAQHNPTGVDWGRAVVEETLSLGRAHDAWLLVDDAYVALHDPAVVPTRALTQLIAEAEAEPSRAARWLCVRSLGKQYACNGWSTGAVLAQPALLESLLHRHLGATHAPASGALYQHALASFLADAAARDFSRDQRVKLAKNRSFVTQFLRVELGFPAEAIVTADCTPYLVFRAPPLYEHNGGAARFARDCFSRTGVALSSVWPSAQSEKGAFELPFLRMYIGAELELLRLAMRRVSSSGCCWTMSSTLGNESVE
jgi:N-succinyldiaminopimelate aminotransferase